jgi:hypothetical protein
MTKKTPTPKPMTDPLPKTTKTSFVLDSDLLMRLKLHAVARRMEMSAIVRTLIEDYLTVQDAPPKKGRRS